MIYAETRVPLTEEEKDIVGRVCVNCGAIDDIEYHHIVPLSLGGNDVLSNICPLCATCHGKVHYNGEAGISHSALTRAGLDRARAAGKHLGLQRGAKLTTSKSVRAKDIILHYSKDFLGIYPDQECMRLAGVSRNTFYKYKREIKVQFDFDTYMESFDEYADFSLEDLE